MITNTIHLSDCIKGMLALPKGSVDIIITSPPYNLGIKYNTYKDNKSRQEYLDWINEVFLACKHCLKDDGHFFLNMGYSNIDPWVGMDVAYVARNSFILQNHINWVKSIHVNDKTSGHFKPINSQRYLCPTWEHLFHFTNSGDIKLNRLSVGVKYEYYEGNIRGKNTKENKINLRDKGNCWFIPYETINNKELKGKHPAIFPIKLAEDCIKLSDKQTAVVLDPFMGTGTTAIAAINQNCEYIGFELDMEYCNFAKKRIAEHLGEQI